MNCSWDLAESDGDKGDIHHAKVVNICREFGKLATSKLTMMP